MTYLTGEVSVIHNDTQVNFTDFVYSAVYCNAPAGCSDTINGTLVAMALGDTLEVIVNGNTTTPSVDILFLGNPKKVGMFKTGLISGATQTFPNPEVYRFVNIKTGLPTDG